jgi:hypothetical protein
MYACSSPCQLAILIPPVVVAICTRSSFAVRSCFVSTWYGRSEMGGWSPEAAAIGAIHDHPSDPCCCNSFKRHCSSGLVVFTVDFFEDGCPLKSSNCCTLVVLAATNAMPPFPAISLPACFRILARFTQWVSAASIFKPKHSRSG